MPLEPVATEDMEDVLYWLCGFEMIYVMSKSRGGRTICPILVNGTPLNRQMIKIYFCLGFIFAGAFAVLPSCCQTICTTNFTKIMEMAHRT